LVLVVKKKRGGRERITNKKASTNNNNAYPVKSNIYCDDAQAVKHAQATRLIMNRRGALIMAI
jgi:hypothetical protein